MGSFGVDLLGPIRGWDGDRRLDLGPIRQQALLAVLALHANRAVSPVELLDGVWGDHPPASGLRIIPPYIYRVRRLLPEPDRISHTRDGYTLHLTPDALDLSRFETAVEASQRAEPARAAELLSTALAEFRGEPLAGLPGPYLVTARHRLAERRLQVLAERIELDLATGRHTAVVPELAELVEQHPWNEKFAGLQMLALFRSGRQADALNAYLTTRRTLVEQLGIEPGPELRAIHRTVLGEDEPVIRPAGRDELPRDTADFVGRDDELAIITTQLSDPAPTVPPVVVIDGMAGVGKTALAVRAARQIANDYPDGRLFLDLHGFTPARPPTTPTAALDRLLRAAGVPARQIPADLDERTALWRSETADRRMLVVLDNAATSEQVRPLLPGSPSCRVLVTSRRQLTGLDATHRVALDVLSRTEATTLLMATVGTGRDSEPGAAAELVDSCGRLPLAIRIAGARLRHRSDWTIDGLNQRLTEPHRRLAELSTDDGGIGPAFDLSYHQLPANQQRLFGLLGLIPGADLDAPAAAALAGVSGTEAERRLDALVDANLLTVPQRGRFGFHDLLRGYAELCATRLPETEREAALDRIHSWYVHAAATAKARLGSPLRVADIGDPAPGIRPAAFATRAQSRAWFDQEWRTLVALVGDAADRGRHLTAFHASQVLIHDLSIHYRVDDLFAVLRIAMDATERSGNKAAAAACANTLGMAYSRFTDSDAESLAYLEQAIRGFEAISDERGLAYALGNYAASLTHIDRPAEAVAHSRRAVELARQVGADDLAGSNLNALALALIDLRHFDEAVETGRQAVDLHRSAGHGNLPAALDTLGQALAGRGDHREAIDQYQESLALLIERGDSWNTCIALANLARAQHAIGCFDDAAASLRDALRRYDAIGATDTAEVRRADLVDLLRRCRPD